MNLDIYSFNMIMMLLLVCFVAIASDQVGIMPNATAQSKTSECVQYEAKQKLIHINCKSIHLSDINEHLNNARICVRKIMHAHKRRYV